MEAVLKKIGRLRNLEHLRLVISDDTEQAFVNANAAANNPAANNPAANDQNVTSYGPLGPRIHRPPVLYERHR